MATPVRLQLSRAKGFNLQTWSQSVNGLEAVNCARPGKLGNPFRVGGYFMIGDPHGRSGAFSMSYCECLVDGENDARFSLIIDNAMAVRFYRRWSNKYPSARVASCRGKNCACVCHLCPTHKEKGKPLGVVCAECDPCHVDPLLEIANR